MTVLALSIIVFFVSYGVLTFSYNWLINTTSFGDRTNRYGVTFRDWYTSNPWIPTIDAGMITVVFIIVYELVYFLQ